MGALPRSYAAGDPDQIRPTGYYFTGQSVTITTGAFSASQMNAFEWRGTCILTRIGVEVTTAVASTTVRLGLYSDDGTGLPGTLLLDAGTIDASTTGYKELTISQAVSGRIWIAAVNQGGAPTLRAMSDITSNGVGRTDAATISANKMGGYQSATTVAGALPASFGTPNGTGTLPRVLVKV